MMHHRVVSNNGLTATAHGFAIDVRLPWYRSLPLSVVDVVDVAIDGVSIAPDAMLFELEGETLALDQLRQLTGKYWYVLDSAVLRVNHVPLAKGSEHEISVAICVRPPYIDGLARTVKTTKTLVAN